ncbi:hypothetical protein C2E23DRAFT_863738 [Lenzites betulinus]|nr:hypothetical protein C2E23DRAFT_863738 [Lenzites betulinus]
MPPVCIPIPHPARDSHLPQVPTPIILCDLAFSVPHIRAPWDPTVYVEFFLLRNVRFTQAGRTRSGTCVLLFEESTPFINSFESNSDGPPPAPSPAIAQVASVATTPSIIRLPPSAPINHPAPLPALQPGLNFLHHPEPDYAGQLAAVLNQVAAQAEETSRPPTPIPFEHPCIEHLTDAEEPNIEDLGYPYDEETDELQPLSPHSSPPSTPSSPSPVVSPLGSDPLFLHDDSDTSSIDLSSPPPYNLRPRPTRRTQLALPLSAPASVKRRRAARQSHRRPSPRRTPHRPDLALHEMELSNLTGLLNVPVHLWSRPERRFVRTVTRSLHRAATGGLGHGEPASTLGLWNHDSAMETDTF